MQLVLAQPRVFCAGVIRAINIGEQTLDKYTPPDFIYHDIAQNEHAVSPLTRRGAVFVDDIDPLLVVGPGAVRKSPSASQPVPLH